MSEASINNKPAREASVDIYLVGLGISNIDHITRQAERIMRSCNEILYVDNGIAIREFLETLCPIVTDLISESYTEDELLSDSYNIMAAHVVDSAMTRSPVAFALYGHPTVFALPPVLIKEAAQLLDLSVKAIPGISAIDCILADLIIDPLCQGLQSFEATDLLARRYELSSELPALIWQIGSIETALYSSRPNKENRFNKIKSYLSDVYGENHDVYAVYSSSYALLPSKILEFKLKDMGKYAAEFHNGYTLYIPSKTERAVKDPRIIKDAENFEYLQKITE